MPGPDWIEPGTDSPYEETLKEQAEYFDMTVDEIRSIFLKFLSLHYAEAKEQMDPFERAVSIGIYRVTKLKSACRMSQRSREGWRNRAMELGSPGHLVKDGS